MSTKKLILKLIGKTMRFIFETKNNDKFEKEFTKNNDFLDFVNKNKEEIVKISDKTLPEFSKTIKFVQPTISKGFEQLDSKYFDNEAETNVVDSKELICGDGSTYEDFVYQPSSIDNDIADFDDSLEDTDEEISFKDEENYYGNSYTKDKKKSKKDKDIEEFDKKLDKISKDEEKELDKLDKIEKKEKSKDKKDKEEEKKSKDKKDKKGKDEKIEESKGFFKFRPLDEDTVFDHSWYRITSNKLK